MAGVSLCHIVLRLFSGAAFGFSQPKGHYRIDFRTGAIGVTLCKAIIGIGLLGISSSAMASDWWLVGLTGNKPRRQIGLLDKESIRPLPNGKIRAWGWTYFEDQTDGIATAKYQYEIDCNDRNIRTVSSILYGKTDDVVSSKEYSIYENPATSVAPDTVGETKLLFVCQGKTEDTAQIGHLDSLRLGGAAVLRASDNPAASSTKK